MKYLPIDSSLFIQNRQRFAAKLKSNAVAVLNSNDVMPTSGDGVRSFIQNTDLFYLSGIDEEESILVIFPDAREEKHREILFIKETNEEIAIWEGPKYSKEEASKISGIKTVYWTREFDKIFKSLVIEAERIYLNSNGKLEKAEIFESSGNQEYDRRAIQAVMTSTFPKPEKEIAQKVVAGDILLGFPL